MPQQVVWLQIARMRPASHLQDSGWPARDCGCHSVSTSKWCLALPFELAEASRNAFGLVRSQAPSRPRWSAFASASFAESAERNAPSNHFLRQAIRIFVRHGPCTVPPLRQSGERIEPIRGAARALLLPELAAGTSHFGAALGLMRARALSRQIPPAVSCSRCGFTVRQTHRQPVPPGLPSCPQIFDVHNRHRLRPLIPKFKSPRLFCGRAVLLRLA